jgi:Ca2+-binding RTX toxin-like protein
MRRTLITTLVAIGCLGAAQAAVASTLVIQSGSTLQFSAGAAETNSVTVSRGATLYTVTDPGSTITPTGPCLTVNANTATCPVTGVTAVSLNLGDLNDQAAIAASVKLVQVSISGGAGNDTINGGPGNDRIESGAAPDGTDIYNGGPGIDTVDNSTRTAALRLTADGVADDGEAGENDNIGADIEQILGGAGNDTIIGSPGNDTLQGNDGNDTVDGSVGDDVLGGGSGNDTLAGGAGNDSISGGTGADTVQGGAGDDTIFSGFLDDDPDVVGGGAGTDLADYSGANDAVNVSLDGASNDGVAGEDDNVGVDVEDIKGSGKADTLTGSAAANELDGGDGNDTLSGLAGADGLDGGRGADTLDGGAGIDALAGGAGADRLRGRDNSRDDVSCGGGVDTAVLDARDDPRACDIVSRGVAVASATRRGRTAVIRLTCPAIEGVRCTGTLTLRSGTTRVGGRSFSIASGTTAALSMRLNARGRRARGLGATTVFRDALGVGVINRRAITLR